MSTATDSGVRSGKNSTEMWMFAISVGSVLVNGTEFVNVPWEIIGGVLGLGGVGMSLRGGQKTVATYVTGRGNMAPAEREGDRRVS